MPENTALKIVVKGIVQGVGFRPFVYGLAQKYNLFGSIRNTSYGVDIEITGPSNNLELFQNALKNEAPPLSRIDSIETNVINNFNASQFEILSSQPVPGDYMPISPDMSMCDDCLRELFDPTNRRYRYPFINCTNCGPRFSIIKDIPYDRPFTTMANFKMCNFCASEYKDPGNRRFHAQPIACPDCGPQVALINKGETIAVKEAAIEQARLALSHGKILAIKGLGGYHLACDASNPQAVANLRSRKKRSDKPFALMAFNLDLIRKFSDINPAEADLIKSQRRPIVLLHKKPNEIIVEDVAPGQSTLGFMLPYTPLHYLLLQPAERYPEVFVMTSGNISEEPIAYLDREAFKRLDQIADLFLVHDRPIHMRVDDSVSRIILSKPYLLRRSRGYAPESIQITLSG